MSLVNIVVSNQEERKSIEFIANYVHVQDRLSIRDGSVLSMQCGPSGQDTLLGPNTICRSIADLSARRHELLGANETSQAQIMEWLSFRTIGLSPITEEKLTLVSQHLLSRMYLVDTLSLADLCLFTKLHAALIGRYCNLVRWFDHIQHTADIQGIYKKVDFAKPGLPEPPQIPAKVQPAQSAGAARAPEASSTAARKDSKAEQSTVPPKPEVPQPAPEVNSPTDPPADSKDNKQAKKDARKAARKEAEPSKAEEARIDMLDIRIGQIVDIQPHPNADALYVEQINLGEDKPRQVVSGLRNFVAIEHMQGKRVVVCTNLKPAKMRDVMSYGMVLCASNAAHDKVDPLNPPETAKIGDRVTFTGFDEDPIPEINPKKKILEKLKEFLQTDSVGVATYKSIPFMCSGAPVISKITNASVG